MSAETFTCCETPMPWPAREQDRRCEDCGLVWEREPVDLGAGARIKDPQPEADFPDGFRGAGPVYAAIPLGTPWLNAATAGLTTYVLEAPCGYPAGMSDEAASAAYDAFPGYSAFLDRGQAEAIADARGDGTFARFDGLTGHWDCPPGAARDMREADEELAAGMDSLPGAES